MNNILIFMLTFFCGAVGCVFWVYYSEKNHIMPAVLFSCFNATVIGIESFLRNHIFALAYILGFGAGTYLAIKIKMYWLLN